MTLEAPTFKETETLDVMTSFKVAPSMLKEFLTACKAGSIDRSKALRFMMSLFLSDPQFQERVLKGAKNNG